jgi:predicted acyl esterase
VQGSNVYTYARWIARAGHPKRINADEHAIHTGGRYNSHLLVPVIPDNSPDSTP